MKIIQITIDFLKETQDKREQAFDRTYKLNLEKNEVEKLCQQKRKHLLDLEKQKLDLEKQIAAAKVLKDKTDIEFKNLKLDSTNKEEQLKRLNKETETYLEEKKKLITNKENKDTQIKDIKGQIQLLQNKKIPQINHERAENEEKEKKLREQIKDLVEENDAKTKEIESQAIQVYNQNPNPNQSLNENIYYSNLPKIRNGSRI